MLHRRIAYGMALIAAVLFQICFSDYLSWFVLVLVVCFPFLSLGISLPVLLGTRLKLAAQCPTAVRGQNTGWEVAVSNRYKIPLARLTFELRIENQLTGECHRFRRSLSGCSDGRLLQESEATPHCGRLVLSATRPRVCDLLGIFSVRLPEPVPAVQISLPLYIEPYQVPEPAGDRETSASLRPRLGGGPGEDYDLRPYRPGDPMRSVHWKLSAKLDELVVRETLEPLRPTLVLTYDHFGTPETLDAVFDELYAVSRTLLAREQPHSIQWINPVDGQLQTHAVSCERELLHGLEVAFSMPAPVVGNSILDSLADGPADRTMKYFHIAPRSTDLEGGTL